MKPILAIASMVIGASSMGTLVHLTTNPKAFLSDLPPIHNEPAPAKAANVTRTEDSVIPPATQVASARIKSHPTPRIQPASVALAPTDEEPTLIACSDWRPLGPSSIESGVGIGEHKVKLLCPTGVDAEDTFKANVQLHPTKMRLNDWSQMRQE